MVQIEIHKHIIHEIMKIVACFTDRRECTIQGAPKQ